MCNLNSGKAAYCLTQQPPDLLPSLDRVTARVAVDRHLGECRPQPDIAPLVEMPRWHDNLQAQAGRVDRGTANDTGVELQGGLYGWFYALSDRLRRVRVCCGDWSRVCGPSPTVKLGITGVFLDPPYGDCARQDGLYASDSLSVAQEVREWAIANGNHPDMRIALCGYEGEHAMPESWDCVPWKAHGGYGSQGDGSGRENASRERIWFSPHCLQPMSLF